MKKKWIIAIYILLLLIFFKLTFNFFYNGWVIMKYNMHDYSVDFSALMPFNFFQPYIAHYNNGNIYYQEEDFEAAIKEYSTALTRNPPKYRECSIRINLALAKLGLLEDDYTDPAKRESTIAGLKEARAVLLEDNCATEEGDGHSKTAEKLKEEIDRLLEELQAQPEPGDETQESTPEQQQAEDELENSIREELQQNQSDAYKEREEEMQFIEDLELDYNFFNDGGIW